MLNIALVSSQPYISMHAEWRFVADEKALVRNQKGLLSVPEEHQDKILMCGARFLTIERYLTIHCNFFASSYQNMVLITV